MLMFMKLFEYKYKFDQMLNIIYIKDISCIYFKLKYILNNILFKIMNQQQIIMIVIVLVIIVLIIWYTTTYYTSHFGAFSTAANLAIKAVNLKESRTMYKDNFEGRLNGQEDKNWVNKVKKNSYINLERFKYDYANPKNVVKGRWKKI